MNKKSLRKVTEAPTDLPCNESTLAEAANTIKTSALPLPLGATAQALDLAVARATALIKMRDHIAATHPVDAHPKLATAVVLRPSLLRHPLLSLRRRSLPMVSAVSPVRKVIRLSTSQASIVKLLRPVLVRAATPPPKLIHGEPQLLRHLRTSPMVRSRRSASTKLRLPIHGQQLHASKRSKRASIALL